MSIRSDHERPLRLLAASPDGFTEGIMLAHGFDAALLTDLVGFGLVSATIESVGRKRPIEVVMLRITEAGKKVSA